MLVKLFGQEVGGWAKRRATMSTCSACRIRSCAGSFLYTGSSAPGNPTDLITEDLGMPLVIVHASRHQLQRPDWMIDRCSLSGRERACSNLEKLYSEDAWTSLGRVPLILHKLRLASAGDGLTHYSMQCRNRSNPPRADEPRGNAERHSLHSLSSALPHVCACRMCSPLACAGL